MVVLSFLVLGVREFGLDQEGVGTKVITLSLEEVGRQVLRAVTIEPGQSSGEGRGRKTHEGGFGNDISPAGLGLVDSFVEKVVEEQVLEVVVGVEGSGDVLQENRADNASSAPHEGDGWLVELPLVLTSSLIVVSQELPAKMEQL